MRYLGAVKSWAMLLFAVGCGGSAAPELPAEWSGARALALEQSACTADAIATMAMPGLTVTTSDAGSAAVYHDAELRCNQRACGYTVDADGATRVLVQPCDMHPATVARCDCLYDISFALMPRAARTSVELYRRNDFYAADVPPPVTLVATAALP